MQIFAIAQVDGSRTALQGVNQHDAAIDIGEIIQIVINVASCLAEQLTEDIGSIDWQCRIDGRVGGKLFACEYHFFGMVFQCGQRFGFGIGDDGERFDNAFTRMRA